METTDGTDMMDVIFRLGFIQGAIDRDDVRAYFIGRGVTEEQIAALKKALMPFAAATLTR